MTSDRIETIAIIGAALVMGAFLWIILHAI